MGLETGNYLADQTAKVLEASESTNNPSFLD